MSKRHCFVPGCNTGCKSVRTRNKLLGIKNPTVFTASSAEQVEEWKKYIPRKDRQLTKTDCVCELHFLEEDVIKYYKTKLSDGTLHLLERGRYKLRKDAVPLIFPCFPNYLLKAAEKRRRFLQNCSDDNDVEMQQKVNTLIPPELSVLVNEVKSKQKVKDSIPIQESIEFVSNVKIHQAYGDSLDSGSFVHEVDEPLNTLTYTKLTENIDCIVKPNMLWGITCHELFVMCALWDENGELRGRVVIDRNMHIKFFRNGRTICLRNELTCVEDVSALLAKINGDIVTG